MKEVQKASAKQKLLNNPGLPYGLQVSLRTRQGRGYINALNRQQKKCCAQLKGVPGCGPRVKDWLLGYQP